MFVFSQTFPVTSDLIHTMFWELHGFLLHANKKWKKKAKKLVTLEWLCFPILSLYYENSLLAYFWYFKELIPHTKYMRNTFGIFELSQFLCTLYGNSLFSCFGHCMDFCFVWNISETYNFGMFCFTILFPCYRNSFLA